MGLGMRLDVFKTTNTDDTIIVTSLLCMCLCVCAACGVYVCIQGVQDRTNRVKSELFAR